jgi:glycosyltransferase involved in cell wall biosynthesis
MAKNIVVLAPCWGFSKGGINSFNFDFCIELLKTTSEEIWKLHIVTSEITEEIPDRINHILLDLVTINPDSPLVELPLNSSKLLFKQLDTRETIFIGHDILTGLCAVNLAKESKKKGIKALACVFHHMNYKAYATPKISKDGKNTLMKKIKGQKDALSNSDIVFAIGPKLKVSASTMKNSTDVYEFIPGLIYPDEEINLKARFNTLPIFNAITYGRVDSNTDKLKQFSLAVAAFGKSLKNDANQETFHPDSKIRIVGIEPGCDDWINETAKKYYDRYSYCLLVNYQNRSDIFKYLMDDCHLSLVVSTHERFGLSGLESIAAEIPLILTKNSGIYDLLCKIFKQNIHERITAVSINGQLSGEPNEEDVIKVSELIGKIANDYKSYVQQIKIVKRKYERTYTWEKSFDSFFTIIEERLSPLTSDSSGKMSLTKSKEELRECIDCYRDGDMNAAFNHAMNALTSDPTSSTAFYFVIRTGIRIDKPEILNTVIKTLKKINKDDKYYGALMNYERSIKLNYKKVLQFYNKIKVKTLQHHYDAGMSHFYLALIDKNIKTEKHYQYKRGIQKSLSELNKAKQIGTENNQPHWWVDLMLLVIYKLCESFITRSDWKIDENKTAEELNEYICTRPNLVSARIYRLFMAIIQDNPELLEKYILEDKDYIARNQNLFLPLDLIDSVSNRVLAVYESEKEKLYAYNSKIEEYIQLFQNKSI